MALLLLVTLALSADVAGSPAAANDALLDLRVEDGDSAPSHTGDVVTLTVRTNASDRSTVTVENTDGRYTSVGHLTDGDGDGRVRLAFNTYTAGSTERNETFRAVDSDDDVDLVEETGSFVETNGDSPPNASLIPEGTYRVNAIAGHSEPGTDEYATAANETDTFELRSRPAESVRVWRAPNGTSVDRVVDSDSLAESDLAVTRSDELSLRDVVVFELDPAGLEGVVVAEVSGSGPVPFENADAMDYLSLAARQTNPSPERITNVIHFERDDVDIGSGPGETYYLAARVESIEPDAGLDMDGGQEYGTMLSATDAEYLTDDADRTLGEEFTLRDPDATVNTDGDDLLTLEGNGTQTIHGSATLAPGTELTVDVRAIAAGYAESLSTSVDDGGEFTVTTDIDSTVTSDLEVTVRYKGTVLATVAGNVTAPTTETDSETAAQTATPTESPSPTSTETTTRTETATPTVTDEDVTTGSGPGFGPLLTVAVLVGFGALALRRGGP